MAPKIIQETCQHCNTNFLASNSNRYRSEHAYCSIQCRFWYKVNILGFDECWEWKGAKIMGYGHFRFFGRSIRATKISWMFTHHESPLDFFVLHKCDNPGCVNPNHLFLGTQKENIEDMVRKGHHRNKVFRGEANGNAKLTDKDIVAIRKLLIAGETQKNIGKVFYVSQHTIYCINIGKGWTHIPL